MIFAYITAFIIGAILGTVFTWMRVKGGGRLYDEERTEVAEGILSYIQSHKPVELSPREKILHLFDYTEYITDQDVERLLGVDGHSAHNYLTELEAGGKIKAAGEKDGAVNYVHNK